MIMAADVTASTDDAALVAAFEAGRAPDEGFHHANHVRVAWIYLGRLPLLAAAERFVAGLGFAAARTQAAAITNHHARVPPADPRPHRHRGRGRNWSGSRTRIGSLTLKPSTLAAIIPGPIGSNARPRSSGSIA
jgi:hypothetical protein